MSDEKKTVRVRGVEFPMIEPAPDVDMTPKPYDADAESWWWLSFADGHLPKGQQFLGVAIVRGTNIMHACARAHRLGCNPGGSVQGQQWPLDFDPPEQFQDRLNRLLTRDEAEQLDRELLEYFKT